MPLNLGLVAHTAQTETIKLAAEGVGNRPADTGLTDPRGAHQQKDRAINLAFKRTDGQKLSDALFHIVESVMVLIEFAARMTKIEIVSGAYPPRHRGHPVKVISGYSVLGTA